MKKYQGIILIHIWNISNLPEVTAVSFHLPTCPYFPWTLNVHQVSSNSSSAEPEKSHVAIVRPFHMHWWRRCPRPHLVSPFEIPWPLGRVAKLFAIASLRVFVLTQQDLPHDIQIYIYMYIYNTHRALHPYLWHILEWNSITFKHYLRRCHFRHKLWSGHFQDLNGKNNHWDGCTHTSKIQNLHIQGLTKLSITKQMKKPHMF